jgi:hypothetical protein
MSQSKTEQHAIAVAERRRQAVELRKAGAGFEEIAKQVGCKDVSGAYRAIHATLWRCTGRLPKACPARGYSARSRARP